jgi:uncharacterized Tic20 family protein
MDAKPWQADSLQSVAMPDTLTTADRRVAALAHLGVPIYGLFLPLIVWAVSASKPFRRAHARQAFSFQCIFLALWVVAVGLTIFGALSPLALLSILAVALLIELPQVRRALVGEQPFRMVPFEILQP